MLTIRPTKMLARRLGITLPEAAPVVANRVADWCVHDFRVGRYRYLIFCNTASLYPVVMLARGVTDDHRLIRRLLGGLQVCLVGTPMEFQFHRWIVSGKSILGSINDLILQARYGLENRDYSPVELSRWLAETPMSALGMNSPARVFAKLGR
jgi:hypothetical protein